MKTTRQLIIIASSLTVFSASYAQTGNGKVGVGTTTPVAPLHILHNASSNTEDNDLVLETYSPGSATDGSTITIKSAKGSVSSPQAFNTGEIVGGIKFMEYLTTGFSEYGGIQSVRSPNGSTKPGGFINIYSGQLNDGKGLSFGGQPWGTSPYSASFGKFVNNVIDVNNDSFKLGIYGDLNVHRDLYISNKLYLPINNTPIGTTVSDDILTVNTSTGVVRRVSLAFLGIPPSPPSWGLTGNSGTTDTGNFIGTTDDVNLILKRNNVKVGGFYNYSIGLGRYAFESGGGNHNVGIGDEALRYNDQGYGNTAVGAAALKANGFGYENTAIGKNSATGNTSGSFNVAIGFNSLGTNSQGSSNTAIGIGALSLTTGSNNVGLGGAAGNMLTTGSNNIAIGAGVQLPSPTGSFQLSIGNTIYALNIGGSNTDDLVGIGTSSPTERLEVSGKVKASNVIFTGIPTYATDAAAGTGGLVAGEMYKTATGELRIKL